MHLIKFILLTILALTRTLLRTWLWKLLTAHLSTPLSLPLLVPTSLTPTPTPSTIITTLTILLLYTIITQTIPSSSHLSCLSLMSHFLPYPLLHHIQLPITPCVPAKVHPKLQKSTYTVHTFWAVSWLFQNTSTLHHLNYFRIPHSSIWHLPTGVHFPHQHTKCPHIRFWGKSHKVEHFRSSPFYWELCAPRTVVFVINNIPKGKIMCLNSN